MLIIIPAIFCPLQIPFFVQGGVQVSKDNENAFLRNEHNHRRIAHQYIS